MDCLTWDDSYAIAKALRLQYPETNPDHIDLDTIYKWTIELPGFQDDPEIANSEILIAIIREWTEEA
jgi:FeS assembly protein IscX